MKYLKVEVEVEGAPEQAEAKRRATGDRASDKRWSKRQATEQVMSGRASDVTDWRSLIRSSERSPMPES